MRRTFRFYKTDEQKWYVDLPEWTKSTVDLEMVEGADTMLDKVSENNTECYLEMSDEPFDGSEVIRLVNDLSKSVGGGDYIMERYKGEFVNHQMWLCAVVETVFGEIPRIIFIK